MVERIDLGEYASKKSLPKILIKSFEEKELYNDMFQNNISRPSFKAKCHLIPTTFFIIFY